MVYGLGFKVCVQGSGFGAHGLRFEVWGGELWKNDSGFGDCGSTLKVCGLRFVRYRVKR
jgi:hypothetical protein